jgi:hypothetical protein
VAVEDGLLWELGADGLALGFLLVVRDGDVAALPGRNALFEGDIGDRATAPQDTFQRTLLRGRGPEFLLLGFAHRLHVWPRCTCMLSVCCTSGDNLGKPA